MDTGAQVTMISKKVVGEVGLQPTGHMSIMPVTGAPSLIEKYRARIDIPIESQAILPGGKIGRKSIFRGLDLEVGVLPYEPTKYDVLFGMNFLCGFHITMYGNSYILSN